MIATSGKLRWIMRIIVGIFSRSKMKVEIDCFSLPIRENNSFRWRLPKTVAKSRILLVAVLAHPVDPVENRAPNVQNHALSAKISKPFPQRQQVSYDSVKLR